MEPTALSRHNTTLRDSNLNQESKDFDAQCRALVTKLGQGLRKELNSTLKLSCVSSSTAIQYVIFMYMKHLGVRMKEQRNLESKRVRINFLPSKLRVSAHSVSICLIFFLHFNHINFVPEPSQLPCYLHMQLPSKGTSWQKLIRLIRNVLRTIV